MVPQHELQHLFSELREPRCRRVRMLQPRVWGTSTCRSSFAGARPLQNDTSVVLPVTTLIASNLHPPKAWSPQALRTTWASPVQTKPVRACCPGFLSVGSPSVACTHAGHACPGSWPCLGPLDVLFKISRNTRTSPVQTRPVRVYCLGFLSVGSPSVASTHACPVGPFGLLCGCQRPSWTRVAGASKDNLVSGRAVSSV